jgi:DNA primase
MINYTKSLKQHVDLRHIVERDLGQPSIRSGRAHLYRCPFHNEQKGFSLAVWVDGYRCFGKCDIAGDAFDWLMSYRHLSFTESVSFLDSGQVPILKNPAPSQPGTCEPPNYEWQASARKVVEMAENMLWSSEGEPALTYLLKRGLTTTTIQKARLGYIPRDYWSWREIEGLKVPCGITIPWFAHNALWAVKVRRASGEQRYVQIAGGSTHGLYNADSLHNHKVAIFCEGEFDALILQQEAGELVTSVTLGSATNRLSLRWLSELVSHQCIFVAYDSDVAGKRGTERLLTTSPRFQQLPLPDGKDINDFYLQGGDVYLWIEQGLDQQCLTNKTISQLTQI